MAFRMLKRGFAPLFDFSPLSSQERGIKGVRSILPFLDTATQTD
jgi:hypothetical protein